MMTHLQLNTMERLSKTKRWDPSINIILFTSLTDRKEENHGNYDEVEPICMWNGYPAVSNMNSK